MKIKMSRYIKLSTGFVALSLMLSTTACTDEVKSPQEIQADENAYTFSMMTEGYGVSTRAYSDASMVNKLFYAIFKKTDNGEYAGYEIDPYYHQETGEKYKVVDYTKNSDFTVKLLPDPDAKEGQEYRIVCWAQYMWTKEGGKDYVNDYYDLSDFPNIKVNYTRPSASPNDGVTNYPNNDEGRDAFYASLDFQASQKGTIIPVELIRPFAQINVGTSGWDYEGLASIKPNPTKVVKYSTITVKGVASSLNLVERKTTDEKTSVTFEYAKIPAYRNVEDSQLGNIKGLYETDRCHIEADPENEIEEFTGVFFNNDVEEFLKIDLSASKPGNPGVTERNFDENGDTYADYLNWADYSDFCSSSKGHKELIYNIFTETFKYLSMCYVLVPFNVDAENDNKSTGHVVDVEFNCSTGDNGQFKEIYSGKNVFELKNVPVASNHRTNIIAADGTGFFMNSNEMYVAVYSEPFADYYKRFAAEDQKWDDMEHGGDNGADLNGDYGWPAEDPEQNEAINLPEGLFTDENVSISYPNGMDAFMKMYFSDTYQPKKTQEALKYIHAFNFVKDKSKNTNAEFVINGLPEYTMTLDQLEALQEGEEASSATKDYNKAYKYNFYLKGVNQGDKDKIEEVLNSDVEEWTKLQGNYYDNYNNGYKLSIPVSELEKVLIKDDVKTKFDADVDEFAPDGTLTKEGKDILGIPYYKILMRVELVSRNEKFYHTPSNNTLTKEIRVYPIIKTFRFSADSNDEGGEIFRGIQTHEARKLGSTDTKNGCEDLEANCYFIWGNSTVKSQSGSIEAYPRPAEGKQDKIFALVDPGMGDHLKFRGASSTGHWVILKDLENCDITIKMGRDKQQDNTGEAGTPLLGRAFVVNIDNASNTVETWGGYSLDHDGKEIYKTGTGQQTKYSSSETKIMKRYTDGITGTKDVKISSLSDPKVAAGFTMYWIILSEK